MISKFDDLMRQLKREYDEAVADRDAYRVALEDQLLSEAPTTPPPAYSEERMSMPTIPPPPLVGRIEAALCRCGCSYTAEEFARLPLDATHLAIGARVEVRECHCGGPVVVVRDEVAA